MTQYKTLLWTHVGEDKELTRKSKRKKEEHAKRAAKARKKTVFCPQELKFTKTKKAEIKRPKQKEIVCPR